MEIRKKKEKVAKILGYTPNEQTLALIERRSQERRSFIKEFGHEDVVLRLSDRHWMQLESCVHEEDDLIHLDESGFSVNHGSVGSHGIRYDFT